MIKITANKCDDGCEHYPMSPHARECIGCNRNPIYKDNYQEKELCFDCELAGRYLEQIKR